MSTGRMYAGETASDRDARRRRQLLDAGLELFGTTGYRAATVRGICREARVADRNFYEFFPTTEDLLIAVYDECADRLEQAAMAAVVGGTGDGDAGAMARAGLDAFLGLVGDDPRLARVVWVEVLGVSPRVEEAYTRAIDRFAAMLLTLAPRAPGEPGPSGETGEPDTSDATSARHRLLSLAAVGGISQVVIGWVAGGLSEPREVLVDVLADHLAAIAVALHRSGA